jgi:hypothetical protein
MSKSEWLNSNDAGVMIDYLWHLRDQMWEHWGQFRFTRFDPAIVEKKLASKLHQYYVACCGMIGKLLPQEESRRGIELAELYFAGMATAEELNDYTYLTEGATFVFEFNTKPDEITRWEMEVLSIPQEEMRAMLHPPELAETIVPGQLLWEAASFANAATNYGLRGLASTVDYHQFLSAELLRTYFDYPGSSLESLCG